MGTIDEYWGLYYHIYTFLVNGGTMNEAFGRYDRHDAIIYFNNFIKVYGTF
jgi:hypothetical protein